MPNHVKEALMFDAKNKEELWREAIKKEMGQLIDYSVFKDMGPRNTAVLPHSRIQDHQSQYYL